MVDRARPRHRRVALGQFIGRRGWSSLGRFASAEFTHATQWRCHCGNKFGSGGANGFKQWPCDLVASMERAASRAARGQSAMATSLARGGQRLRVLDSARSKHIGVLVGSRRIHQVVHHAWRERATSRGSILIGGSITNLSFGRGCCGA